MFRIGDVVEWTSQSSGSSLTKRGIVTEVIVPGTRPDRIRFPGLYRSTALIGMPRNHESYVVLVGSKPYWPRVSQLKQCGVQDDPAYGYRRLAHEVIEPLLRELSGALTMPGRIKDAYDKLLKVMSEDSRNQDKALQREHSLDWIRYIR